MIYLLGWGFLFFILFFQSIARYRGYFFIVVLLVFFAVVAFVRGSVGTDTSSYERMLQSFLDNYIWVGREPGFFALGWLLTALLPSVELAVRSIALVFFGILAWFVVRSDRNERFLFLSYILPAFAYQYSMNALRIGLASAILLVAVQVFRRKGDISALRVGFLALFFHYSSVFSLLFFVVSQCSWAKFSNALGVLALLLGIGVIFIFLEFYIMNKFSIYQEMQSPGAWSGLSKVVPLVFILIGLVLGNLPRALKFKLLALSVVSISLAWLLAKESYAGLRVLDLLSFSVPLAILVTYSRAQLLFDRTVKLAMVLAGLISAAGVWRGFLKSDGEGDSSFLPYEVFNFQFF